MSKKDITVLGIHLWHDSGASIVQNGKVCAAINEDKIINIKHASGYPIKSIEEVFKIANIGYDQIDAISVTGVAESKFPKPFWTISKFFKWIFAI